MYVWDVFTTLTYLLFCSKKFAYSDPNKKGVTTELIPIELNLRKTQSNSEYDCQRSDKGILYTVKNGYGFSSVVSFKPEYKFRTCIWKASNSSEYSNKVILISSDIGGIYKIFIHLFNGTRNVYFKKLDSPWKRMDVNRNVRIPLNLYIAHSTCFYHVKTEGGLSIFTPNTGFIFDSIINWNHTENTKWIIWKAGNINECSRKIEFFANNSVDSLFRTLMIYLINGRKIKLVNDSINYIGSWVQVDLKEDIPVQIRIDNTNDSLFYENYLSGPLRVFDAKPGFVFNRVIKWNDKCNSIATVWETSRREKYSRQVLVERIVGFKIYSNNVIIFHLDGTSTHFTSVDDGWAPIEPCTELDIDYKFTTIAYQYIKVKNIEYFIPNGSFLFNNVLKKGSCCTKEFIIWTAKNKWQYVKKVFIVPIGIKEKFLVLLLVTNELVLFLNSGDSLWRQQPKDEYAIHRILHLGVNFNFPKLIDKKIEQEQCRPPEYSGFHPKISQQEFTVPKSVIEQEKLIALDISKMHRVKGYDIFYGDNKVIFTARVPYLFSSVSKGNDILWKPKFVDDYPDKVIYKVVDGNHKIKVYFPDENRMNTTKSKPRMDFNPSDVEVLVVKTNKPDNEV